VGEQWIAWEATRSDNDEGSPVRQGLVPLMVGEKKTKIFRKWAPKKRANYIQGGGEGGRVRAPASH